VLTDIWRVPSKLRLGDQISELFRGFLLASSPAIMVQITQHFRHLFDVYRCGAQ
jgi:hypothetical protein